MVPLPEEGEEYTKKNAFPMGLVRRLDKSAETFTVLHVVRARFEDRAMVIHMLKHTSRKLISRDIMEVIIINTGSGKNERTKKGLWLEVLKALFGSYAIPVAVDILNKNPPSTEKLCPALLALRGGRLYYVSEAES